MKLKKLMAALENCEEAPIPESVVAVAEGNTVDPQVVDSAAPVNEPSTIPDAGEMPAGIPEVSPLPVIEEAPIVAEAPAVVPAAIEGEGPVIAEEIPLEAAGELIIESPLDHDNTMDMMDQTIVESTALSNDLTEVVETQVALEQYAKLLRQAGPDGISRQAAGYLRVGLEQFQSDGHIDFSKLIASMEDMGEGEKQHLLPSKLKSDTLGSKIKEAAGKIWEFLKKLIEKGKKFVNDLRNGVIGLERKLNAANKAAQASKGSKGEFKIPNPDRIAIAGKVNPNFPAELKAITGLAAKVYPERMTQFYNALASAIGNYDPAHDDMSSVRDIVAKAGSVLEDIKFSDRPLPGGVAIDVSDSGLSYGIKEGEGGNVGDTTAQARSSNIIQSDLKDMGTVLQALKDYPKHYENMAAAAEKVGQALERLKKASAAEGMENSAAENADNMSSSVGQLLHKANPRGNEIIRYLARTTSAYVDVILAELKVNNDKGSSDSKEVAVA